MAGAMQWSDAVVAAEGQQLCLVQIGDGVAMAECEGEKRGQPQTAPGRVLAGSSADGASTQDRTQDTE